MRVEGRGLRAHPRFPEVRGGTFPESTSFARPVGVQSVEFDLHGSVKEVHIVCGIVPEEMLLESTSFACPVGVRGVEFEVCRGTSLMSNPPPVGPYSSLIPRDLCCSQGGGCFLWAKCPCMNQ